MSVLWETDEDVSVLLDVRSFSLSLPRANVQDQEGYGNLPVWPLLHTMTLGKAFETHLPFKLATRFAFKMQQKMTSSQVITQPYTVEL